MPFHKQARITLSNETATDVELVAYQITYVETEVPEAAGTFHAQYRRAPTAKRNPYVILDGVKGRGRYVGTFLAWTQMEKGWFGEGEIKFFMDGDDQFPTICGTGTEDYFLGSYGFPRPFTTAYSGTVLPTSDGGEPPNFWSLYRWRIQDPINFNQDLRVTIQALGWGTDGKYKKIVLHGTRARDYGTLRFVVNGKAAQVTFDGYAERPAPSGPINLGVHEPKDGKFILRVEVVGTNPAWTGPRYYFGLDAVVLEKP